MTTISNVNIKKELSPCVNNCQLNKNDVCIGCYRSISEIIGWGDKSETQKIDILARCSKRKSTQTDT